MDTWRARLARPLGAAGALTYVRGAASDEALLVRLACEAELPHPGAAAALAWSPGGGVLASAGECGRVRLWPACGGGAEARVMDVVSGVSFG